MAQLEGNMKTAQVTLEDAGVWHPQYWPGAGIAHTPYVECYVGVGMSAWEAGEDALDQAAADYDIGEVVNDFSNDLDVCEGCENIPDDPESDECGGCELQHYVVAYIA